MAAYIQTVLKCIVIYYILSVQITQGLHYETNTKRGCLRRLPFALKNSPLTAKMCPLKKIPQLMARTMISNIPSSKTQRRRRSILLPGLPLLLPPIVPKLPLLPLPLLPLPLLPPPLSPLNKLKKPLKPLKVPILGKRSILSKTIGTKLKPIKVPGLDLKAGKRKILDHLIKLKRKGSLTTDEFLRFRKLLLR